jgi:hypothetical protein
VNRCTGCGLDLDPHNISGVCLECKHIERDRRRGYTAPEVPLEVARAAFMAVFAGHYRQSDASVLYATHACAGCGKFRARTRTGRCEWCSGPRRHPRRTNRSRPRSAIRTTQRKGATPA